MDCQRWVVVAVALGALTSASAAPVPKVKPREGTILMMSGYPDVPPRLLRADGTLIGELPFKSGWDGAVSPDGTRVAVILYSDNLKKKPVHVVRVGAGPNEIGLPLATVDPYSFVAWGGNTKLYFNEYHEPLRRGDIRRPDRVTVYDLERGTATEDKALRGYRILELSADGKLLLAQRFVPKPAERWEFVLLDAATGKPVNSDLDELSALRFDGPDGLLGSREKKGAPNDTEWITFDFTTKRAVPLKLPKEVTGKTARVSRMLPSPDGKRLLYVWSEEVPLPVDWPVGLPGPLRAARMTTCDRDGGNARTIFKPEIKTREDETRNHFGGTIDWR